MSQSVNYPDILGLITDGQRASIGVLHAALAARPQAVPAGASFEMLVLLQNTTDADLEVAVMLHLPESDQKRQRGRFQSAHSRLVVTMNAAEVGYVALLVAVHAETAPGRDYRAAVEIEAKPTTASGKPRRVREAEGGGAVNPTLLNEGARGRIGELKPLQFSTARRRSALETAFDVLPAKMTPPRALKPGWVSVWKAGDYQDDRLPLHLYGHLLQVNTLPGLKRAAFVPALTELNKTHFSEAGFALTDAEARLIAKLMTLILEYAAPKQTAHGYVAAGAYGVTPLLEKDPLLLDPSVRLPHWCRGMLTLIGRERRAAMHPLQAITKMLYYDLLLDALEYGFQLVTTATGEDVGSADEMREYNTRLIELLRAKSGLDFNRVYLPLVMGGILINDSLLLERENPSELLQEQSLGMEARRQALPDDDLAVFEMTSTLIERTSQKYGLRLK